MSTEDRIRGFIIDELKFRGSADELTDDYPLLEREVLDSMGIFQVVSFIEAEFGIEVDDEELIPENFATVGQISELVASKQAS